MPPVSLRSSRHACHAFGARSLRSTRFASRAGAHEGSAHPRCRACFATCRPRFSKSQLPTLSGLSGAGRRRRLRQLLRASACAAGAARACFRRRRLRSRRRARLLPSTLSTRAGELRAPRNAARPSGPSRRAGSASARICWLALVHSGWAIPRLFALRSRRCWRSLGGSARCASPRSSLRRSRLRSARSILKALW